MNFDIRLEKTVFFTKIRFLNLRTFFVSKTRFVLKFKSCQPFSHFQLKKTKNIFEKKCWRPHSQAPCGIFKSHIPANHISLASLTSPRLRKQSLECGAPVPLCLITVYCDKVSNDEHFERNPKRRRGAALQSQAKEPDVKT